MDYETISAEEFGAGLTGLGLNLLVKDIKGQVAFLTDVFGMRAVRVSEDFAIILYGKQVFQIHSDGTYHAHPLLGLVPENGLRGGGLEIRLYESDPDAAAGKAEAAGGHILQEPTNKPHGLREACILCGNGYAWVPSRALSPEERKAV